MASWILVGASLLSAAGCATNTQTGALVGTGIGTGLGAVIGHQIGKGTEGALIGAALGAGTGALAGNAQDERERRDAAYRYAARAEATRQAHARAMTNRDVIDLTRAQVSDSVIQSAIQDRGGIFDTSPAGIIALKQAGVSDAIIQCMQRSNMAR